MSEHSPAIPGLVTMQQTVDPEVSKTKFDRELAQFMSVEQFNRTRGVLLLRASFPDIVLAFAPARVRPLIVALAVKINFTNYDVEAPSVQFVDPLTEQPLNINQLLVHLRRASGGEHTELLPNGTPQVVPNFSCLIQAHQPYQIPFLCLPGVREYHAHPAHSNDPWLAHRKLGEGTLGFIIDQIHKYGTAPIIGYGPQSVNINGNGSGVLEIHTFGLMLTAEKNIPS